MLKETLMATVNTVMNFRFPYKDGNFSVNRGTITSLPRSWCITRFQIELTAFSEVCILHHARTQDDGCPLGCSAV
jgi:hypothetical protein